MFYYYLLLLLLLLLLYVVVVDVEIVFSILCHPCPHRPAQTSLRPSVAPKNLVDVPPRELWAPAHPLGDEWYRPMASTCRPWKERETRQLHTNKHLSMSLPNKQNLQTLGTQTMGWQFEVRA